MSRAEVENKLNDLSLKFLLECMEIANSSFEDITVSFDFRLPHLSKTTDYRPFWIRTKFGSVKHKREVFGVNSELPLPLSSF